MDTIAVIVGVIVYLIVFLVVIFMAFTFVFSAHKCIRIIKRKEDNKELNQYILCLIVSFCVIAPIVVMIVKSLL